MSARTSFRLGGPADRLVGVKDTAALIAVLRLCADSGVPVRVLGNGTNVLVNDGGLRGVVISMPDSLDGISVAGCRIACGAGTSLKQVCAAALEHSLTGLEFAYGIPGSVGGAVYMNAGAYNGEIKDVLSSVSYVTADGEEGGLSNVEAALGYRTSVFKTQKDRIITGAVFELRPGDSAQIRARMDEIIEKRRSKQPLEYPSAGSTFKRPDGYFAGALIEGCGLKGFTVGGASVSVKHAGFVINSDRSVCTAADVEKLINHIRDTVRKETGVELEPEVEML